MRDTPAVQVAQVTGRVVSIQVGQPRAMGTGAKDDKPWTSSFVKEPVEGARWVGRTNLQGDVQACMAVCNK